MIAESVKTAITLDSIRKLVRYCRNHTMFIKRKGGTRPDNILNAIPKPGGRRLGCP